MVEKQRLINSLAHLPDRGLVNNLNAGTIPNPKQFLECTSVKNKTAKSISILEIVKDCAGFGSEIEIEQVFYEMY